MNREEAAAFMRASERLCWLLLICFAVLAYSIFGVDFRVTIPVISIGVGIRTFTGHGGVRVTALGVLNVAIAMIVGVGGLQEALQPQARTAPEYLLMAMAGAVTAQVLVNAFAWSRWTPPAVEPLPLPGIRDARWLTRVSALVLLGLLGAKAYGLSIAVSQFAESTAFAAVVLLSMGLLLREKVRAVSIQTAVILGALGIYATQFQGGSGRLRLVAAACAVAFLMAARFPTKWFKRLTVLLLPAGLWLLAQQRLSVQESIRAGNSEGRTGLESMTDPILVFSQVIEAINDGRALEYGKTFLTVPFTVLPAELAPSWLPMPLGYELVTITAPERFGTGYSVAVTVYGEFWLNFGLLGLALAVPALVCFVGLVDRRLTRALDRLACGRSSLLWAAFWLMVAGAIADLGWMGTHTFAARMLTRLPVLIALAVLVLLDPARRPGPQPVHFEAENGQRSVSLGAT